MRTSSALTRIEVVVILFVSALLVGIVSYVIPKQRASSQRSTCVMNLKQLGTGFRMAIPNGAKTAWPNLPFTNDVSAYVNAFGDQLSSPKVLICPADNRTAAITCSNFQSRNISYFIAPDADEAIPSRLLSGDRNITLVPLPNTNIWDLGTNKNVGWSSLLHNHEGNVGFSDGSVRRCYGAALRIVLTKTGDKTNRIVMPISDVP